MKNYKTLIYYFNIRSDTLKIVCFTLNIFITKNCGGLSPPNTTREKYIFTINKTKCFEDFEVGNVYFGTAIIIQFSSFTARKRSQNKYIDTKHLILIRFAFDPIIPISSLFFFSQRTQDIRTVPTLDISLQRAHLALQNELIQSFHRKFSSILIHTY